ncbi:perlucin-like protein [Mya arenaria]|nr:perlucin-like protein [Mya arenaria]
MDGWVHYEDSCYLIGHTDLSFIDAQRYCQSHGANLVNLETPKENTFLKGYLSDLKDSKHWIGLTDEITEGVWKQYPSEELVTFTDWGTHQPNNGKTSNCAAYWESFGYHWVDEPCTSHYKALCEMPFEAEHIVG